MSLAILPATYLVFEAGDMGVYSRIGRVSVVGVVYSSIPSPGLGRGMNCVRNVLPAPAPFSSALGRLEGLRESVLAGETSIMHGDVSGDCIDRAMGEARLSWLGLGIYGRIVVLLMGEESKTTSEMQR